MIHRRGGRLRSRLSSFLSRRDPGHLVVHRAVRVTAAASLGFFVCRYLFGDANTAVYALFGAVALGALSEVSGPPHDAHAPTWRPWPSASPWSRWARCSP